MKSRPGRPLPDIFELDVSEPGGLGTALHTPFLERASDPRGLGSEQALGAFLVLRLVDQFARDDVNAEAVGYQTQAALNYVDNLLPRSREVEDLRRIAAASQVALRTRKTEPLTEPLISFAAWLESKLRYAEALDTLDTAGRVAKGRDNRATMAVHLQRGRVLRRSGRFSDATAAYAAAGTIANTFGDSHTELLSRVGRGIVLQQLGNFPAAGKLFEEVRREARRKQDRDAEARASHDLGVNFLMQKQPARAVKLEFHAYCLYETAELKSRALADLATAMKELGHYTAAKDAYELILRNDVPSGMQLSVALELMDLAALVGDRLSFERQRRKIEGINVDLPPDPLVDFQIKLGTGLASFGRLRAAKEHLRKAIEYAEQHNLNEYLFRAEAALSDLERESDESEEFAHPANSDPEVVEVARELHHLVIL